MPGNWYPYRDRYVCYRIWQWRYYDLNVGSEDKQRDVKIHHSLFIIQRFCFS